jgi:hypothetical protein
MSPTAFRNSDIVSDPHRIVVVCARINALQMKRAIVIQQAKFIGRHNRAPSCAPRELMMAIAE